MKPRNWKKILLSLVGGLLVPASIYAANATLPHTFSAGTPIRAQEVNANFTALRDAVNTKADTGQTGASSGQRLKLVGFTSSDGLRLPSKYYTTTEDLLYDAILSMYCVPEHVPTAANTREYLCIPDSYSDTRQANNGDEGYGSTGYYFADANCNTRFYFAEGNNVLPAGLPPAQRYITDRDSNDIFHMYRLGQRVTGAVTVYRNSHEGGSAGCVNLGSMPVDFYVRGNELPLAEVARLNPGTL